MFNKIIIDLPKSLFIRNHNAILAVLHSREL